MNKAKRLPLIYAVDNLEAARAAQARSQASLNAVREEDLWKQRYFDPMSSRRSSTTVI
jgi:hypothetical protein